MNRQLLSALLALLCVGFTFTAQAAPNYPNNRAPLVQKPYVELPLGAIKAKGWLLQMLENQRSGATGQMDQLYPLVMGERNGWLGGDGDQWERGPYWIDGLLPLAYLLDDEALKQKVQPWIEWTLASQREDGFFGPAKDYPYEPGVQRDNSADWWPRMVMLKILQQYYSATGDERVVGFLTNYFRYQLNTLPEKPLGNWTFWAEYRACDNLQAVYWLYNITGDAFLLDLGKLIHQQAYDFVGMFLERNDLTRISTIHCVNLAQGLKEPVIYYQQDQQQRYLDAVKKAFADIRLYHGQAQGMYGGDEQLHGSAPTQGVEFCSVVELMFSLEKMIEITGDLDFVDHLERVAFNALPAQATDDFGYHQYYQQANQVKVSRHRHNFDQDHAGTDILFGILSGYPCCASNQHQGWPKFTQHLWYATPDNGLAALVFSPSEVTAKVGNGVSVTLTEETHYPMDGKITFTVRLNDKKTRQVDFPFHVRIPSWTKGATITVNGERVKTTDGATVEIISRTWKSGDRVELEFPMTIRTDTWHENAVSVERGPLVYALKMEEQWGRYEFPADEQAGFGDHALTVDSPTPWNYAFTGLYNKDPNQVFTVRIDPEKLKRDYPWNPENAPISITGKAKQLPYWSLYNESAGPQPYSPTFDNSLQDVPEVEITLIPYGATTLRISEFPMTW